MTPAEGVIDRYRRRLDPSKRYAAMPAHVTVLYPFMAPSLITAEVCDELAELFGRCDSFDFTLSEVRWFDRRVVYLAPSPVASFRALTATVTEKFPGYQPYEGAFDEVMPHVTIGEDARYGFMRVAGALVKPWLPIRGRVTEVWLMTIGHSGPLYRVEKVFPLR